MRGPQRADSNFFQIILFHCRERNSNVKIMSRVTADLHESLSHKNPWEVPMVLNCTGHGLIDQTSFWQRRTTRTPYWRVARQFNRLRHNQPTNRLSGVDNDSKINNMQKKHGHYECIGLHAPFNCKACPVARWNGVHAIAEWKATPSVGVLRAGALQLLAALNSTTLCHCPSLLVPCLLCEIDLLCVHLHGSPRYTERFMVSVRTEKHGQPVAVLLISVSCIPSVDRP